MKRVTGFYTPLAAALLLILAAGPAVAQFPAAPSDNTIPSLGKAILWVHPNFAGPMSALPGWNTPSPNHWTSPYLFDSATVIGHSAAHLDGDASDVGGTPVGTAMTIVSDANFGLGPHVNEGPVGIPEVHTEIYSLDLQPPAACPMPVAIRAGTGMGVATPSFGEVESLAGSPNFPAESFFHVFVEVDLPIGITVYNSTPLVVSAPSINSLPPTVVYIHGLTPAVPVYVLGTGQLFGYLRLAGHQTGGECQDPCGYCAELENALNDHQMMPCSRCRRYTDVEPLPDVDPVPTTPQSTGN